ncbi:hypothetical protein [Streptomyces sp. NPDC051452]|uniref:hypothetical protein n=1 Tax=Streptomyces sp. NPDC051452 TaxID=3365654 RepID=UPI0037920649
MRGRVAGVGVHHASIGGCGKGFDLVNGEATFGELAWNRGAGHAAHAATWPRQLWFRGGELVAWAQRA